MKPFFPSLAVGILLFVHVAPSFAQNNGLKSIDTKGTLINVGDYLVVFKANDGTEYTAYLNEEQSTFTYRGTADPKAISAGLMVRFVAKFDKLGNAESELKEMEIFTPRISNRMPQSERMAQTPGIYPTQEKDPNAPAGNNANNRANAKDNAKDKNKNAKGKDKNDNKNNNNNKGGEFIEYRVVGQITAAQSGKVQISTGSQVLVVQLASNAKVNINTIVPTYCAKGDEVQVVGLMSADLPTAIQATRVTVTGAKPVGKSDLADDKKDNKNTTAGKGNSKTDNKQTGGKKPDDKTGADKKPGDKPGKPGSTN